MKIQEFVGSFRPSKLILFGIGTLALSAPSGAPAQAPPEQVAQPTTAASPTPSDRAGSEQVATTERVVVTASKREENVQEVPSSVSVIDDVELDNLHATQLSDYSAYIPGLQVGSGGSPGQTTIALRGLAPISSGATVSTYIDEVPAGSSGLYQAATTFELDLLPYDIRRVEVLRGPQGTLYGANSIGGLVKYVTLDPSLTTREFHVGGGLNGVENSEDIGWDAHISGTVPLANNTVGLRASYTRNELPGFIDNVATGEKSINSGSQQGSIVALLWEPNDKFNLRITALGQKIESDNNAIVRLAPITQRPMFGDLQNRVDVDEPFEKKIGLLTTTLNVNLGWADLTSASGYSNTKTDARLDTTTLFGQAPVLFGSDLIGISGFDLGLNLDKFTQEIRLTSKADGRFLWQLGAFYTYERADQNQLAFLRQQDGTPFTGDLAILNTLAKLDIPSTFKEYAGFANATYKFTDRLSLGAGLRYAHNDQNFAQIVTEGILVPLGNTPGRSSEDILDFMVNPQFKLGKDQLLYARIASGYQPGGPNIALPGVPPTVDSTTVLSYEVGLKSEFFEHRLLFDLAGYHIDQSDIQVGAVINNVGVLINGGEATSNGVELSAAYEPVTGLRFGVTGAYTDATLSNDTPALGGLAGDRLPNISEFSGALTADYYFPLWGSHTNAVAIADGKDAKASLSAASPSASGGWKGHVGAGLRLVGDRVSEVESSPTSQKIDSYAALDLNADISNANWTVRVYVRNLTDERAYQSITAVSNGITGTLDHLNGVPIQPRTVGVEVDFRF